MKDRSTYELSEEEKTNPKGNIEEIINIFLRKYSKKQ